MPIMEPGHDSARRAEGARPSAMTARHPDQPGLGDGTPVPMGDRGAIHASPIETLRAELLSRIGQTGRRNLIVVKAGRGSLHPAWMMDDGSANFELLVAEYEPSPPVANDPGAHKISLPSTKVQGYDRLFRSVPELLSRFDYVALFDDDLSFGPDDANRLFEYGTRYDLDLFQPALSRDSHHSYAATVIGSRAFRLRYCNYVEMMCPVFRTETLARLLPLFELGYETGIDMLWSQLVDGRRRMAIVDDVVIRHTRAVGSNKTANGFSAAERYDDIFNRVLALSGLSFHGIICDGAIARDGRLTENRLRLAVDALSRLTSLFSTPMRQSHFVKHTLVDVRNQLLRTPVRPGAVPTAEELAARLAASDHHKSGATNAATSLAQVTSGSRPLT